MINRYHPRRIELSTASSRAGIEQRGAEAVSFYQSGTCACGCNRGSHDYPAGPCMTPGCGCKELRIVEPKGNRAA